MANHSQKDPLQLSLSLLGSFQCFVDGESRNEQFRTKKERALLAYLAIESNRPHQREALAEMFWPDKPEGYARTNLRQALSGIRQAVQNQKTHPSFLLVSDEFVQVNPKSHIEIDCKIFDQIFEDISSHQHQSADSCPNCIELLNELIKLYRGDFLDECLLSNTFVFQEWVLFQREHYFRRLLTSIHYLIKHFQNSGDIKTALEYAYRQANLAPLEESAHRQLMLLLAMDGRRSAAMEQYQTCCRILSDELEVTPDLETTALYEKIKSGLILNAHRPISKPTSTNLPVQFTKFIGREKELDWIYTAVQDPQKRLFLITGISGVGKTRFAIQAGAKLLSLFKDGVWFVPLDSIHAVDLIPNEISRALNLEIRESDPRRALLDHLRSQEALLIIDNFEHLIEGTSFILNILHEAPKLKIIVTTQRRLSTQAAHLMELKGLPYPGDFDSAWENFDAVELFVARAKQNHPDFRITNRDVPHLIRICKLVDGSPLGLELAAAGLRFYSCEKIAQELQHNSDILMATMVDIPERHRSLRAAFNQSWQMLPETEQDAYRRLSIFQGEFSIDSAVAATGAPLHVISSLVDRSLIQKNSSGYYLIQPMLRQFAAEKLQDILETEKSELDFYTEDQASITRDPLTQLPNRVLFRDLFKQAIAIARRSRQFVALLIIEINDLEKIRKRLDLDEFNLVLRDVAKCLTRSVRECDIVAHLIPGKYAIILENISRFQNAGLVAEKITENLHSASILDADGARIKTSIGISVYPDDSENLAELISYSHSALNESKSSGEPYRYFAYEKPILFPIKTLHD